MRTALPIIKEVRKTAFELVIIPGIVITAVVMLTNKKVAKRIRDNINTMKGYY